MKPVSHSFGIDGGFFAAKFKMQKYHANIKEKNIYTMLYPKTIKLVI